MEIDGSTECLREERIPAFGDALRLRAERPGIAITQPFREPPITIFSRFRRRIPGAFQRVVRQPPLDLINL